MQEFSLNYWHPRGVINEQAPKYIQQLLHRIPQLNHNLRSSSKTLLSEPTSSNKNKFQDKTFFIVVPKTLEQSAWQCEKCNHSRQLQKKIWRHICFTSFTKPSNLLSHVLVSSLLELSPYKSLMHYYRYCVVHFHLSKKIIVMHLVVFLVSQYLR